MTARDYMVQYRVEHRMSLYDMHWKCKVSTNTLWHLEEDDEYVTHPNMVERIAKAYELTEEQKIGMLPRNYRPGPDYDPNRYVIEDIDEAWRSHREKMV